MRRAAALILLICLLCLPVPTRAADEKNKGLFITPLRQYVTVNPGQNQGGTITVANLTDKSAAITMSVEQFSVVDYTYDHRYQPAHDNWVTLSATQFNLQPDKSQTVVYSVSPTSVTPPGGHYFTILASTVLTGGGTSSQVRAATLLYVTVNGELHRTSVIKKDIIPLISFGGDITFSLDVKDTGNTHFFTYTSGQLYGLSARGKGGESTHLLLPGTSRILGSSIPAPLLPGVYKAIYGYRTDAGQTVQRERHIIYVPPWSILVPVGLVWLVIVIRRKRHRD